MKSYKLFQIDAFTDTVFKGNPAGVVTNADGLSSEQMQQIARELNNSETAFWLSGKSGEYDGEIRYFTPTTEVPICGHATVATMYAKYREGALLSDVVQIKTGAGILPFKVEEKSGKIRVTLTQGKIEYGDTLVGKPLETLILALGLDKEDIAPHLPVEIVSTGHSKVMVGVKCRQTLNQLTPDLTLLSKLSKEIGCNGYFVFTFDSPDSNILTYGRMFAPAIGIDEDPVTGNANGPLGAYLVKHGVLDVTRECLRFTAAQGEAIGRMGTVDVEVSVEKGNAQTVRISGTAVTVFETQIRL